MEPPKPGAKPMTTATYENVTYSIPAGLTVRANGKQVECGECSKWEWLGDSLRHAKGCASRPQAERQVAERPAPAVAANGRKIRANRHSGACEGCGHKVEAHAGELFRVLAFENGGEYGEGRDRWGVRHLVCP